MMYSYYTLSLMKFSCPWKLYLTQAQLIQFTSVLIYTAVSFSMVYRRGDATTRSYFCYGFQTFEMVSLFYLFSLFYSKAYKKKPIMKRTSSELEPEQSSLSSDSSISSDGESKKEL